MQLGINVREDAVGWVRSSVPDGNYRHAPDALSTILRSEGVRGLYAGYGANLMTGCAVSAVQFMLYERFKLGLQSLKRAQLNRRADADLDSLRPTPRRYREDSAGNPMLRTRETLLAGAMAGSIAGFVTNPLDVIGTRIMVQGRGGLASSSTSFALGTVSNYRDCFQQLILREGFTGLWRGGLPRVLWCASFSALSFSVYEAAKAWLHKA